MALTTITETLPGGRATAMDEAKLLDRAMAGDGRAFSDLVTPHLSMLHRLAWRQTHDSALAEDAVQETLIKVYEQLAKYQAGTSFRAWMASIATKRAYTLGRSERRRSGRESMERPESLGVSAEALVGAAQSAERLNEFLERMPLKRRQALVLRMDAGLPHAEIAEALGTSVESVRVMVHMGLKELKAHYGEVTHG